MNFNRVWNPVFCVGAVDNYAAIAFGLDFKLKLNFKILVVIFRENDFVLGSLKDTIFGYAPDSRRIYRVGEVFVKEVCPTFIVGLTAVASR